MGMYWPVVIGAIIILIVLGIKVYWEILLAFFPQRERASEIHTVTTKDMWEISLFRYRRGRSSGEPILLVHGAGANHHNFTEPEGASIVDDLVARGYDCWVIDTRVCRSAKPAFERAREDATIDDILLYDLPAAVRYIRKATSYGRVHWVGHSLGGMLLYAYIQHWGTAYLASGTTLGSPIGFTHTRMPLKRVPWFSRKNPRGAANVLRALIPILYFTGSRSILFPINMKNLHARMRPGNLFQIVEDPMPKAMDQLLGWATTKTWTMLGGTLDVLAGLRKMDLPLFVLYAAKDPFVDHGTATTFFNALPNPDKRIVFLSREAGCQQDYSHCDMAFGADGPRMVNDPIARWIEAHPIEERVRAEEIADDDEPVHVALGTTQRAEILTGISYAHLAVDTPIVPPTVEAAASTRVEEAPVTSVAEAAPVPPAPAAKPKGAKKATAKARPKAAAAKASPATAKSKASAKPKTVAKPKAKTKPSPAKKKSTASSKPTAKPAAKAKATAKPIAKIAAKPATKMTAKPIAKPTAKPAVKAKPAPVAKKAPKAPSTSTTTPRVTLPPAKASKGKPSLLTKSAIASAGEALRSLEGKKKS